MSVPPTRLSTCFTWANLSKQAIANNLNLIGLSGPKLCTAVMVRHPVWLNPFARTLVCVCVCVVYFETNP